MATRTTEQLIDDLDGSNAAETVRFSLDGTSYEIDLNARNAKSLRKALKEFQAAARPAPRTEQPQRKPPARRLAGHPKLIRMWAAKNGITVSPKGRISAQLREQYLNANR